MDSIISTFHIDWKTIIAQMINFGVVFVVLYVFALKPLAKIMRDRTEKIEKGIEDAKENEKLIEQTHKEYEAALSKAKAEANVLYQDMKKDAAEKKASMMAEAEKEVATMIENGRKTLESEKNKMVADAKKEVAALAVQITEKLIGEKVDSAYEAKAVNEVSRL
ncbi:MAG TPA: F0F1 ATP synthase subunit B [Candidatus Paceibacterota bacterium]|nr:F0F1 ATP synthase subunit B [Candidatus Paceibacterota bacterium]